MKHVMTKAWEIAREGQRKFGGKVKEYFAEALRIAWRIVKGEIKEIAFKGTEKQVAWAKNIYAKVVEYKNWYIELANSTAFKKEKEKFKVKTIERIRKVFESLMKEDSASFWIDHFKYITYNDYEKKDFMFKLETYAKHRVGYEYEAAINLINRKNNYAESY